jgi:hypothetical protein
MSVVGSADVGYIHCGDPMSAIWHSDEHMPAVFQCTDFQCEKCELVIEVYGDLIIDGMTGEKVSVETISGNPLPANVRWHYRTTDIAIGVDEHGNDVRYDRQTGKLSRIYSQNQRKDAVEYAGRFGATKASRKFDIPVETIRSWAKRTK